MPSSVLGSDVLDDSGSDDDLSGQLQTLDLEDDLPPPIVLPSERGTIADYQKVCAALQVKNADLRKVVAELRAETADVNASLKRSGPGKSPKSIESLIPVEHKQHAAMLKKVAKKAALYLHPWPEMRWFEKHKRPGVDPTDVKKQYASQESQEKVFIEELIDFVKAHDENLQKLIGKTDIWLATCFIKWSLDQKCKIVNVTGKVLPYAIPRLANEPRAHTSSPAAHRAHPYLKQLRGHSFDHLPPVLYPSSMDPENRNDRYVFWIPEIGYYFRAPLYGESSVLNGNTKVHSRSNGVVWDAKREGITPGNLALMFTVVRFHVSGKPEFVGRENFSSTIRPNADPGEDKVDWQGEYCWLCRTFHEQWETPRLRQLVKTIGAVAFNGQEASAVQRSDKDPAIAAAARRNAQALAAFATSVPADISPPQTPPLLYAAPVAVTEDVVVPLSTVAEAQQASTSVLPVGPGDSLVSQVSDPARKKAASHSRQGKGKGREGAESEAAAANTCPGNARRSSRYP
ncbi:hypothetical protein BC835DRAFT_1419892 [Cytidiella melzeri]|nr:hypothetical protein BC835DRAFT_1419892 [Cytidiella melzeri]